MRRGHMGGFATGLALAGVIGLSAYMMNGKKKKMNSRAIKKNVNKAVKNVSSFIDEVTDMVR